MHEPSPNANISGPAEVPLVSINKSKREQKVPLLATLNRQPTWIQQFGGNLASRVLWFVCGFAGVFLIAWWFTRPSLVDVRAILGASAPPKDILETWRILQREHFDQFRDLFQIVVLSGLVPLFTLLAGYAFGVREREKAEREGEE